MVAGRSSGDVMGGRGAGAAVRIAGGVLTEKSGWDMAPDRQAGGQEKVAGGVVKMGLLIVALMLETVTENVQP